MASDKIDVVDDLEFVRKCATGDTESWKEFLKRYSRLIYKYIHSVLNSKNILASSQDYVDDIFQEFFSSLIQNDYRKLKTFKARNNCSLASWLRQVTINLTLDYLRRIRPLASLDDQPDDGLSLKEIIPDGSLSVPELLSREEMLKGLQDCVGEMSSHNKLFIELNINQGVRLEALKDLFKLSRGAIDMQKSRLMERLRECFKKKGFKLDL